MGVARACPSLNRLPLVSCALHVRKTEQAIALWRLTLLEKSPTVTISLVAITEGRNEGERFGLVFLDAFDDRATLGEAKSRHALYDGLVGDLFRKLKGQCDR
jgi:hypothetical protein